ncbi:hypothetical protein Tco_0294369 [Tanacetum coccineum]
MSIANSHVTIVYEGQLVPYANRLVIKKNNQHVASDSDITDTMLRFVVGILRHHKLYKPVSLNAKVHVLYLHQFLTTINHNPNNNTFHIHNRTLRTFFFTLNAGLLRNVLQMHSPNTKTPYTKPPTKNQILGFIKTLGYDEDPKAKMTFISTFFATRLRQQWRAILSVLNRSLIGKDSSWDTARLLILQILWGIVHFANLDFASLIWDEFEWKTVDRSIKPSKMSKLLYTRFTKLIIDHFLSSNRLDSEMHSESDDSPITKLMNTIKGTYMFGMEIPDTMIDDTFKKSAGYRYYKSKKVRKKKLLRNQKSKVSLQSEVRKRLYGSDTIRSVTCLRNFDYTMCSMITYLSELEFSLLERMMSNMDLVMIHGVCTSLNRIRPQPVNISAVSVTRCCNARLEWNSCEAKHDAISSGASVLVPLGASEVPLGTHVDVQERNILLQEMFQDESALHILSILANKLPYTATTSQPNSLQAKARKLMQKAKKNMREINFKKAVAHKFSEYDHKLEALTNFNVSETFEKAVQARVLTEIKKLIPTHIPKALANYVKPHLNTFLLEVMKNNHISLFTKPSTNTDDL